MLFTNNHFSEMSYAVKFCSVNLSYQQQHWTVQSILITTSPDPLYQYRWYLTLWNDIPANKQWLLDESLKPAMGPLQDLVT